MSHKQVILQGFQQLCAQVVQEEQQKPQLVPEQGPQQNAQQQLQRLAFGFGFYLKPRLSELIQWAQRSRETTNFTYDLTDLNIAQLAGWVSVISSCTSPAGQPVDSRTPPRRRPAPAPQSAHRHLRQRHHSRSQHGLRPPPWLVCTGACPQAPHRGETGGQGLGSCVLASALLRNHAEGHPGRYVGTDINPRPAGCSRAPTEKSAKSSTGIRSKASSASNARSTSSSTTPITPPNTKNAYAWHRLQALYTIGSARRQRPRNRQASPIRIRHRPALPLLFGETPRPLVPRCRHWRRLGSGSGHSFCKNSRRVLILGVTGCPRWPAPGIPLPEPPDPGSDVTPSAATGCAAAKPLWR